MSFQTTVNKLTNFLVKGKEKEKKKSSKEIPNVAAHYDDYGNLSHSQSGMWGEDFDNGVLRKNKYGYTAYETDRYNLDRGIALKDGKNILKRQYAEKAQEIKNDPNREKSDEAVTDRSFVDRLFGMLGYGGITEGLYNLTDDDASTTFGQGLVEGLRYMNPFEDDVTGRNSMSDVLKNMGWEDEDPDKLSLSDVARGVVGFAGDVLTDPLSYINPFGAASKVVKGSGYGLDVVKRIEQTKATEAIKGISKVADYLHDGGKTNIEKLTNIGQISFDTFKKELREVGAYRDLPAELFEKEASRAYEDMHKTIHRVKFSKQGEDGFTMGVHHLPFLDKKAQALKMNIIDNETLTKLGDKTISPYYNSLAKQLRTSRLAQKVMKTGTEAKVLKGEMTGVDAAKSYIINDLMRGVKKAVQDGPDIERGQRLKEYMDNLTEEQKMEVTLDIESGLLDDARQFDEIREFAAKRAEGDVEYIDNMASAKEKTDAKTLSEKYDNIIGRKKSKEDSLANQQKISSDIQADIDRDSELLKVARESVDPHRNLFYRLQNTLPGLTSDDDALAKTYEIAKNLTDIDLVKTMHKFFSNKPEGAAYAKLIEKISDSKQHIVNRFINTRFASMDTDDILDMLTNYKVSIGDTKSTLDDAIRFKFADDPEKLSEAVDLILDISTNPEAGSEALAEIAHMLSEAGGLDYDGIMDLVLNKMPTGANQGEYLKRILKDFPQTRKALTDFANNTIKTPEADTLFSRFAKESLEQQNKVKELESIIAEHKKSLQNSQNLEKAHEKAIGHLTTAQLKLEDEIIKFHNSDYFHLYEDIEKMVVEPGKKTGFAKTVEALSQNLEHMEKIDRLVDYYSSARKHFDEAGQYVVLGENDEAYELIKEFQDIMRDVGRREADLGLLEDAQIEKYDGTYVLHQLTDEGKEFMGTSDPVFENTGGFKGMVGKGKSFGKSRRFDGTIKDINEYYKDKHGVTKLMETDLSKLYLARVLNSNQLVYATDTVNYIKNSFSRELDTLLPGQRYGDLIEPEKEILGVTYHDLNKALNGSINRRFRTQSSDLLNDIFNGLKEERIQQKMANGYDFTDIYEYEEIALKKEAQRIFNKQYADVIRKKCKDAVYDEFFGNNAKSRTLYTPNIPVQELTSDQAHFLKEMYDITPRKFTKDVAEQVNVASKTQKVALQSKFTELYDKFLGVWKLNNTITAPSFHIQNAVSNAFQSFLGISADALNPKKLFRTYNVLKNQDPKQIIKLNGIEYSHKELAHIAKEAGVIDEAFVSVDLGEGARSIFENEIRKSVLPTFKDVDWKNFNLNPFDIKNNTLYQASTVWGTQIESTQRMNHFISCLDMGMSVDDAVKSVDDYLFNYSDLTKTESEVLKRVIPFYTFMRKNIPMELEAMLNRPQVFKTLERGLDNIQKMNGNYVDENYRNEWRQDYIQFPVDVNGQSYGINLNFPYQQLDRLNPAGSVGKLIGSTTPLIKVPYELATGTVAYTGMPVEKKDYIFSQLGILPSSVYRGYSGDGNDKLLNATKVMGFPMAEINNYARAKDLTEEEKLRIFEEVYGFTPN